MLRTLDHRWSTNEVIQRELISIYLTGLLLIPLQMTLKEDLSWKEVNLPRTIKKI